MDKQLEMKLVKKYPIIFKDYGGDIRKTCMGWGLECGDGWFKLINEMCEDVTKLIKGKNIEIIAIQVKEKFGGLRFYYVTDHKITIISKLNSLIKQFMFSNKFGKQYWLITDFRKRFWKTTYEKISDRIREAELDSYKICDICGNPGKRRGGDWIKTLCDNCRKMIATDKIFCDGEWLDLNNLLI
jgi:hypothetical protein